MSERTELTTSENRECDQLEEIVDDFQVAYQNAGRALSIIKEKLYYKRVADSFETYVKKRFGYSRGHAYRLIEAYQACLDVKDVMSPVGDTLLDPPRNESVARELAKVKSPEKRADVWAEANKTAGKIGKTDSPSASHVAKTAKAMIPSTNGDAVVEEESEPEPLWQQFAAKHAEALNHLSQAIKAMNWIEKHGESAAYLSPVTTRIRTDYRQLRGTITGNCPVGEKDGKISIKMLERK